MTYQQNLMNAKQAAEFLGVSEGTMYEYRALGTGPKYIRIGGRLVRYRLSDINVWLENQENNGK